MSKSTNSVPILTISDEDDEPSQVNRKARKAPLENINSPKISKVCTYMNISDSPSTIEIKLADSKKRNANRTCNLASSIPQFVSLSFLFLNIRYKKFI